jgi:alpha-beta hydrolase superfamily lysophospholipase
MEKLTGELLQFDATDGIGLNGFLVHSGRKTRNVLIHVAGMTGNFYRSKFHWELAKAIKGRGFDLFLTGTRGDNNITGFYKCGKEDRAYIGTSYEVVTECVFDIEGAIRALRKLGYTNFALSGHSTGCQKVTYYQSKKKNRQVNAIVLLAPADDHNFEKKKLGKKYMKTVKLAQQMVRRGRGDELTPACITHYSWKRFLSYALPQNTEARLFNYDGALREFAGITVPVLVVFGSKEEYAAKPIKEYGKILAARTNSKRFTFISVPDANHSYHHKEDKVAKLVFSWLSRNWR